MTVKNVKVFFDAVAFVVADPITVEPFIRISALTSDDVPPV